MKIIDLYNIIAKGQTPPKKIRYQVLIFNWDGEKYLHYKDKNFRETNLLEGIVTELCLNHEVEIIEDKPEKIEKITMCTSGIMGYDGVENITTELKNKTNEVIDKLNNLLEKSDDNE